MASNVTVSDVHPPTGDRDAPPPGRGRGRVLVLAVLAVAATAVVVIVVGDPFAGGAPSSGVRDNQSPTSLATVGQRSLSSQIQVSGTLTYSGNSTIRLPQGTAPMAITQAEGAVTQAEGMLTRVRGALTADRNALAQAQSMLAADRRREQACAGHGGGSCAGAAQAVARSQQQAAAAAGRVSADEASVSAAASSLASARLALATAQSHATFYGQDAVYTALPSVGQVVRRGQRLYAIDGQATLLLYGDVVVTRAFTAGITPGSDVAALNANLAALGYGSGLSGDQFTAATATAIRALQTARGIVATGELLLGSVVFANLAQRVTGVTPNVAVGAPAMPGPVLTTSSTGRQVKINLDAAEQGQVKVGDRVSITLPDNQTTPGRVSYLSTVASAAQGQGGGSPTVAVDVVPSDPAVTGNLDQAPVNVAITTSSVRHALVVPVNSLLALAGGGYAIEVVAADGTHHLVAVQTGLFDDADGLVQVSGSGVAAGQRIVVPGQ
jgi:hypothetical protein